MRVDAHWPSVFPPYTLGNAGHEDKDPPRLMEGVPHLGVHPGCVTVVPKSLMSLLAPLHQAPMNSKKTDLGLSSYETREWGAAFLRTQMKKHNVVNIK